MENLCKKHDIIHLDYLYKSLPDTCYFNIDHLNKNGAFIISQKIDSVIMTVEKAHIEN